MNFDKNDSSLNTNYHSNNYCYLKYDNIQKLSDSFDLKESENDTSDLLDADEDIVPQTKISGLRINYFSNYTSLEPSIQIQIQNENENKNKNKNKFTVNEKNKNDKQSFQNFSDQLNTNLISENYDNNSKNNINSEVNLEEEPINPPINQEDKIKKDEQKSRSTKYKELLSNKIKYNINKIFIDINQNNPTKNRQKINKKQSDEFYKRNIEMLNKQHLVIKNTINFIELEESRKEENSHSTNNNLVSKSKINRIVDRLYHSNVRNVGSNFISFQKYLEEGKELEDKNCKTFTKFLGSRNNSLIDKSKSKYKFKSKNKIKDKNTLEKIQDPYIEKDEKSIQPQVSLSKETQIKKYMKSNNCIKKSNLKNKSFNENKNCSLNVKKKANQSRSFLKNHRTLRKIVEKDLESIIEIKANTRK